MGNTLWQLFISILLLITSINSMIISNEKKAAKKELAEMKIEFNKLKEENANLKGRLSNMTQTKTVTIDGHEYVVVVKDGEPSVLTHSENCKCHQTSEESK